MSEARERAAILQDRYRSLGIWLGVWVGLVVSAKLIQLSLRRMRGDFEPDQSGCVACARCFSYCPVEQVRLGWISDISEHEEIQA